jgi:hypothetical protein
MPIRACTCVCVCVCVCARAPACAHTCPPVPPADLCAIVSDMSLPSSTQLLEHPWIRHYERKAAPDVDDAVPSLPDIALPISAQVPEPAQFSTARPIDLSATAPVSGPLKGMLQAECGLRRSSSSSAFQDRRTKTRTGTRDALPDWAPCTPLVSSCPHTSKCHKLRRILFHCTPSTAPLPLQSCLPCYSLLFSSALLFGTPYELFRN